VTLYRQRGQPIGYYEHDIEWLARSWAPLEHQLRRAVEDTPEIRALNEGPAMLGGTRERERLQAASGQGVS